jgi:hypothetical protein
VFAKKPGLTRRPAHRSTATSSTVGSPHRAPTRCGSPTSPNTAPLGFLGSLQRLDEAEVLALSGGLVNRPGVPRYSAGQRDLFIRLLDRGARFGQPRRVLGLVRIPGTAGGARLGWRRDARGPGPIPQRRRPSSSGCSVFGAMSRRWPESSAMCG